MAGRNFLWEKLFTNKIFLGIFAGVFFLFNTAVTRAGDEGLLSIQYQNSLLSVNIQGASLYDVVQELKRKTGVDFNYKFLPDWTIYANFKNLTLKEGIKQTLPFGTIFVSNPSPSGGETIQSVFILSSLGLSSGNMQGTPLGVALPSPKKIHPNYQRGIEHLTWQAKDAALAYQWLLQLQDEDPLKRVEAITQLGKLKSNFFSVKGLYLSLEDPDDRVNKAATESLKSLDEYNVFKSLRDELKQTEPIIQKHALDVIRLQEGSKWIVLLRQAIKSDQIDSSLREFAQGILMDLQAKSRKN